MQVERTPGRTAFGRLLSGLRRERQMTQRDLAQRVGLPAPHLCQMEKGMRPCGPSVTNRLLRALDVKDKNEFIIAADKTVSPVRRKRMGEMQLKLFLAAVERHLKGIAGENLERVLFVSNVSSAGATHADRSEGVLMMLDDGRRVYPELKVESP